MESERITPNDLGFHNAIDFCVHNWLKLTKEDRIQLKSVGITPDDFGGDNKEKENKNNVLH